MEYRPSLPEENDNISHTRPFREFILLFSGISFFLLALFWAAGLAVDYAVDYITPEMEAKIFSSFGVDQEDLVHDGDPQQAKLQELVNNLRDCIDIAYPLKVHLVTSETANAMAFPGGRILVLKGLLDKVDSENGLSFVLAHELAHFKNRDHLRGMGRSLVITALSALITGAGSDFTQLFIPAVNLNMAQYSQNREELADQQALRVLACRYGHGGGATEFFRAMIPDEGEDKSLIGHYFSSHPEGMERIENLRRLGEKMGLDTKPVRPMPEVFTR